MTFETYIWTTFGAFLTLAIFSFLYKDNPLYKFAEHLFVGVSAGYFVVILWHNTLSPNLLQRLSDGDWYFLWLNSLRPWYLIPATLGVLMFSRFSQKWAWVSRYPMAIYIGISAGLTIPLEITNRVLRQLVATMGPINWGNFGGNSFMDISAGYSQILIFLGSIAALIYFFFSTPHRGVIGVVSKFGIWVLMIGFGATFGFTVMNRISLFANRIQYLWQNWMKNAFNMTATPNPNYDAWFQISFWVIVVLLLAWVGREIAANVQKKTTT
ncbi:MAG: hypothetical protein WAU88_04795 [Candidatus Zixiibacteriota bacterium]